MGGFDVSSAGLGPMLKGPGGVDGGGGFSKNFGKGGAGEGFGTREHIRVSYATSVTELDRGLERMRKFLAAL